jgi:hypothetical protein
LRHVDEPWGVGGVEESPVEDVPPSPGFVPPDPEAADPLPLEPEETPLPVLPLPVLPLPAAPSSPWSSPLLPLALEPEVSLPPLLPEDDPQLSAVRPVIADAATRASTTSHRCCFGCMGNLFGGQGSDPQG